MTQSLQEFLVGLALVAVAVIALISINAGSETMFDSGRRAAMTSQTFPTVLAYGMGLLSAAFTAGAFMRVIEEKRARNVRPTRMREYFLSRTSLITVAVIALLLVYAWLLKQVHFAPLTWAFLFAGFFLFGQRRLLLNAIVATAGMAAFYGLFVMVLELPLNP